MHIFGLLAEPANVGSWLSKLISNAGTAASPTTVLKAGTSTFEQVKKQVDTTLPADTKAFANVLITVRDVETLWQYGGVALPLMVRAQTTTNQAGAFHLSFDVPSSLSGKRVYLTADVPGSTPGSLSPLWRSAPITAKDGQSVIANPIVVWRPATPPDAGFRQAELDAMVKSMRKKAGLEKLDAAIAPPGLKFSAAKSGADVKFKVALWGSTRPDLDIIIDAQVRDFDIDYPWIADVFPCAKDSKAHEAMVRKQVATEMKKVNQQIKDRIAESLSKQVGGATKASIRKMMDVVSLSVWQIDLPVVKTHTVPYMNFKWDERMIVPQLSFGVPTTIKL